MPGPAIRVSRRDVLPTCGYCRSEIRDDAWECPSCATPHHTGCAGENRACTVLGCGEHAPAVATSDAWRGWRFIEAGRAPPAGIFDGASRLGWLAVLTFVLVFVIPAFIWIVTPCRGLLGAVILG